MKIIYKDGHVDECPQDQELHVIRHTAAHIMAQAIKRLYPQADFAFGPATENGFYYDVDLGDTKLTDEDLANIEKEMRKITKENLAIQPTIHHKNPLLRNAYHAPLSKKMIPLVAIIIPTFRQRGRMWIFLFSSSGIVFHAVI